MEVRDSAGIRITRSIGPLWSAESEWTFSDTPLLKIGGLGGKAAVEFFGIAGVERLSDGRIAVADHGAHGVRIFGLDGHLLGTSGSEGAGPGEFRQLFSLDLLAHDSLVVFDGSLYRFTVLDRDGRYVRTFGVEAEDALVWPVAILGGKRILVASGRPFGGKLGSGVFADTARFLVADTRGTLLDTIGEFPVGERYVRIEGQRRTTISLPFGQAAEVTAHRERIYVAPSDHYGIHIYGLSGRLEEAFRLPLSLHEVREDHIERYAASRMRLRNERRRRVEARLLQDIPFPKTFPAFDQLVVDAEGNVWAKEYPRPGERAANWLVLDSRGRWLGRVAAPERFRIEQIGRDYVLGVQVDSLGVESVQMYGLLRPAG